jgi:hypothetical protein
LLVAWSLAVLGVALVTAVALPASAASATFVPVADAMVQEANPSTNYGTSTALRVDAGADPDVESYLRFDVTGQSGSIQSAKLRLYVTSSTANGPSAYTTGNTWSETTITWANRTARIGTGVDDKASISSGAYVEWDVTSLVTGNATYSFVLAGTSSDGIDFQSREATNRPQLVVTTGATDTGPPTAPTNLGATAVSGTRVDLSWTASADDIGVAGYEIFREGSPLTTVGVATAYSDTTVSPNLSYSYQVRAFDAVGNRSGFSNTANVTTPSASGSTTFTAVADAMVQEANPSTNYGTSTALRVDAGSDPDVETYLRFTTTGVSGTVQSAKLRLYVTSSTADAPAVFTTAHTWGETTITWANRTARVGAGVDDKGSVSSGAYVEWNVTSLVTGNATYDFVLAGTSSDGIDFQSREGTNKPQLVVSTQVTTDGQAPTAPTNLSATALSGTRVDLTWTASTDNVAVANYLVFRGTTQIATVDDTVTAYPDTTVSPNTTYSYTVKARDGVGNVSGASNTATVRTPSSGGSTVTIAAAGDIACASTDANYNGGAGTSTACRQRYTSDLLVNKGYAAVLPLGDEQYNSGSLSEFNLVYDKTWGRVKSISHPVVGNHEYGTSGASGYFTYFGSAAGDPSKGYYSFDVGSWHIIALNSNCTKVAGGCNVNSPQETWLRADLSAHPAACTIAMSHHARWSSGHDGDNTFMQAMWQDLYNANVEILLSGHSHDYERFAPQNANGGPDNNRGVRQWVVGTGGAFFTGMGTAHANSQVRNNNTFGILKLTLGSTSYDWQFIPEAGKTFTDSGTTACH